MNNIWKVAAVLGCLALGGVVWAQGVPSNAPPPGSPFGSPGGFNPFSALVPTGLPASLTGTTTTAPVSSKPDIGIAEAAGTLTDPTDFIYLSQEYVFTLLVVANSLGIPGVQFNPDSLPTLTEVEAAGSAATSARTGTSARASGQTRPASRSRAGDNTMETTWVGGGGGGEGSRRTARGAQATTPEDENVRMVATPAEADSGQMLNAITISGNDDLSKLLTVAKGLPAWTRVARLPLQTTEKQKIDKAIAGIYAQAFRLMQPGQASPQSQYGGGPGGSNTYTVDLDRYQEGGRGQAVPPPPAPGAEPQPAAPQGPPPIDPQAMGEWYYYYQQSLAWEQYVNEEVLILKPGEPTNSYNLDTALQPQELYMAPPTGPGAPLPIIHFGSRETPVTMRLSAVKPNSIQSALDQVSRVMEDLASQNAKKDSDRSRKFVANLDVRKERRFRYREWLNDQTTEIRKMAEDYRRRLAGNEFVIDGVQYLVSPKPLNNVPLGSRNIVTERLTPYDLLDTDGTLKKATEETVEQTP